MASAKQTRRQRLDEEYQTLLNPENGEPLCFYGPSLITVIFNAQTIVDATLFFISGGHIRYTFRPSETMPEVLDVHFANPRIPSFFTQLLPVEEPRVGGAQKPRRPRPAEEAAPQKRVNQRARKRCAFFNVSLTRRGRQANEPDAVTLSADVKLFNYTVHVCGLRDARDAEMVMRVIHNALVDNQALLESHDPEVRALLGAENPERRAFLDSNTRCCTVPLVISEGDVVMTNICGKFTKTLNLRGTSRLLADNYPGVYTYLTTMSKSNYLAVTLFEHAPFHPIRLKANLSPIEVQEIKDALHSYLMSGKKVRSKLRKHTFFIHASGRFIQSSRNNATALRYTELCMSLLHRVTVGIEEPIVIEPEVEESEDSESEISE